MRYSMALIAALAAVFLLAPAPRASAAQVSLSVNIGPAPVCPYGYFSYAPYNCAPYGYYGPQWFVGGVFLGAGPWFRGPANFHGYVNNHYDPRHGYHGALPHRGAHATHRPGRSFHGGNEMRDGRGHVVKSGHGKGH
ncbi:MAG TPA: hypothetical protein VME18_12515 [Acidobacteriaceae bacterium]|nr:hypothetical protein [Acidobacteriaceae bacterium]